MRYLGLTVLAIALAGCVPTTDDRPIPVGDGTQVAPSSPSSKPANTPPAPGGASGPVAPDNTGVNERDQQTGAKTPIDQDETSKDVQITADIRKQILATEGMSVNARNSKIITAKGHVTLRGPVNDEAEKDKIEKIAAGVAGAENVTNELEVTK